LQVADTADFGRSAEQRLAAEITTPVTNAAKQLNSGHGERDPARLRNLTLKNWACRSADFTNRLVQRPLNPKSAVAFAARCARTSGSGH
jgi:hypothetical protein